MRGVNERGPSKGPSMGLGGVGGVGEWLNGGKGLAAKPRGGVAGDRGRAC